MLLYHQVEESIRRNIHDGLWPKGSRLPSEPELTKMFNVSRATIRQACANLSQKGILERRQGSGTFVQNTAYKKELLHLVIPPELGMRHKELSRKFIAATKDIADALQQDPGEPTGELYRLRMIGDGSIIGIEKCYFGPDIYDACVTQSTHEKLSEFIEDELGFPIVDARVNLHPIILTGEEAAYLQDPEGSPALLISRVYYTYHSQPILYVKNIIRAASCKLLNII